MCSLDIVLGIWCSNFWLRAPFLKYWGLHFIFRNLKNVNLNISGTGPLIKNCYIRFLELCPRNTPTKFQTTAPCQFFRKWRRSWKNRPEIRQFKDQASFTIACKPQPLGGPTPFLPTGKLCLFPFLPMGKKYMEREENEYFSLFFHIFFFHFSHGQKWGWTPPNLCGAISLEGKVRLTSCFLHLVRLFQLYNILKNQNRAFLTPRPPPLWRLNMYVGKFKLDCWHYFQFRRNWDLRMRKIGLTQFVQINAAVSC